MQLQKYLQSPMNKNIKNAETAFLLIYQGSCMFSQQKILSSISRHFEPD